jgi:hypothetical protein
VTPTARALLLGTAAAAALAASALASSSCSTAPQNVPVRTFERAQKVDVACLQVLVTNLDGTTTAIAPQALKRSECAPVPSGVNGATLPNHLFALVTQTTRGELAVVDLTAGNVVDVDRATPGTNFIPVGANPTDVVVAPDGKMAFVSAAEPDKPAIYGIPTTAPPGSPSSPSSPTLLGDSQGVDSQGVSTGVPLRLTDLPACQLDEPPQSLAIVRRDSGYVVVAVLRARGSTGAQLAVIDPAPLLLGAGLDAGSNVAPVARGSLSPCPIIARIALSSSLPSSWTPGPRWDDGVRYVDGGVDLGPEAEPQPLSMICPKPAPTDAGFVDAGPSDAGDAGNAGDAGSGSEAGESIDFGPLDPPRPTSLVVRDDQVELAYVADDALPVVHVIDMSHDVPVEMAPLLATSVQDPTRRVSVRGLALSPPTHAPDYKRYLYAIDSKEGTIMVFDVTDPASTARTPLLRPHPELQPYQPPDRIAFGAPVAAVAFVQHDWPLTGLGLAAQTGLLCNPNPNAHPDPNTYNEPGAYYRDDCSGTACQQIGVMPGRLRGIFAFATLSNGQIVTIDVDDWDAPCRRPDPLSIDTTNGKNENDQTGALAISEPPPQSPTDFDPYHAPLAFQGSLGSTPVSLEAFFPVSAPHRVRSGFRLRNDPQAGNHIPNLVGPPQLFSAQNTPQSTSGADAVNNPVLVPTPPFADGGLSDPTNWQNPTAPDPESRAPQAGAGTPPDAGTPADAGDAGTPLDAGTLPGVRFSWEDPTVHVDQDWTVTYEGALPGFTFPVDAITTDDYQTLTLAQQTGPDGGVSGAPQFCGRGIEDWRVGQLRAAAAAAAIKAVQGSTTFGVPDGSWTGDYIEVTDDLLDPSNSYWSANEPADDKCWDPSMADSGARYNFCAQMFGAPGDAGSGVSVADSYLARDFPIVAAYDDHLVIGRFGWQPSVTEKTTNRVIVGPDDSNKPFLRAMRCCFHRQFGFKVRTGGEWVTIGANGIGYLHHIVKDPATGTCVPSCDSHDLLLNARAFDVPRADPAAGCRPPPISMNVPDRNSAAAMRNPAFSFAMWRGCTPSTQMCGGAACDHTSTQRDFVWKFSTRGSFVPLAINLTGNTTTAVAPQSMLFIDSLGQLAIVDGASQGLVLIDLNSVAFAHTPYF